MPGQTIAHYRITARLGADAWVRCIEPPILCPAATSPLNHPDIAAIYEVEDCALIMEFVEGLDLAAPMPVDKAIAWRVSFPIRRRETAK